jgi:hypothetical protein
MCPQVPLPRFNFVSRDAARLREEQRRFELITLTWTETQLRQACDAMQLEHSSLNKDAVETLLIAKKAHIIEEDDMQPHPVTGALAWSDPHALFGVDA